MLTLTRTNDLPTILIGDDIKIHIRIVNGQAKVQIDAPKEVKVQRGELRWREARESIMSYENELGGSFFI